MRVDQLSAAQGEGWDGLGFPGIFCKPCGQPALLLQAGLHKAAKSGVTPLKSRVTIKITFLDFRERLRIISIFRFDLIHERSEGWA